MRVAFSRNRAVTPDWQGNKTLPEEKQIKFAFKPLQYGDFTDAAELMGRLAKARGGDQTKVEVEHDSDDGRELVALFKRLLPAHVTSVGAPLLPNVNEHDQTPITVEEIATLQPFAMLAVELLATLIVLSSPTEADLKN